MTPQPPEFESIEIAEAVVEQDGQPGDGAAHARVPDDWLGGLAPVVTVLCVDDEPNILNALRRLFRPTGYRVLTALGGADGLRCLSNEPVDVVISDMRMPEMNGAEFLEAVRRRFPMTTRLLLTGHSEIGSTIAAINRGEIHRYIAKPWDDRELLLTLAQVVERRRLEDRNRRLEELTLRQNLALQRLNADLADQVAERTAELSATVERLVEANRKLDENLFQSVRMFSSVIEMQAREHAGHSKRVAKLVRQMAEHAGLPPVAARDAFLAGLLHDIGTIGLPEHLFRTPESALTPRERALLHSHPGRGASLLMALDRLDGAAALIRAHHERFDGKGYPDGLAGDAVALGAQLLQVADDYDERLWHGVPAGTTPGAAQQQAALHGVRVAQGSRHAPAAVALLMGVLDPSRAGAEDGLTDGGDRRVTAKALRAGMVLSRDLLSREGALLLAAEHVFEPRTIQQIRDFEEMDGRRLPIHVRPALE